MTIIILSEDNLRACKATLHTALPQVGSSHLSEAIASGLGWRSHASMLAALKSNETGHHPISNLNDHAFVDRIGQLGHAVDQGVFAASCSDPRLPHPVFTAFKDGNRYANDQHYRLCSRLERPMMMVKTARRYATLEWDCITVHPREEGYILDDNRDIVDILFNLFQARTRGAPGKPYFYGSAFTGTVKKLLPITAVQLAQDFFQLLYSPLVEGRTSSTA